MATDRLSAIRAVRGFQRPRPSRRRRGIDQL